jgi:hypothetical protein
LRNHIQLLVKLPLDKLDYIALQKHLDDIGRVLEMAASL